VKVSVSYDSDWGENIVTKNSSQFDTIQQASTFINIITSNYIL